MLPLRAFSEALLSDHSGSAPAGFAHLTDFVFGAIAEFFQTVSDVACTAVVAFSKLFSDRAKQKYSANNPFYMIFLLFREVSLIDLIIQGNL